MAGTKIAGVNNGLELIWQELMADPRNRDTVHFSIITFANTAYQLPMTPITSFTPPHFVAAGDECVLGAALSLLNQSLDDDILANAPGRKGDYKPIVLLMMDCPPTDQWRSQAQRLASRPTNRALNTIGLAIGQDADVGVMQQVCTVVLTMQNVTPDQLRAFFDWVSGSIKTASQAANVMRSSEGRVDLPPPVPSHEMGDMERQAVQAARGIPVETHPRIFVSHSRDDDAFTRRLAADLRAAGADVWVDATGATAGDFMEAIGDALGLSEWLVLVLTPTAVASPTVRMEVSATLNRVRQGFMRGIIPIVAAHCSSGSIPPFWDVPQRADATTDYNRALANMRGLLGMS